ncbi:glucosaminidase domain-containing protein [Campylobacter sp. CCUG 57310]|uniref:glucosaminidase domain-containing protein n=1 Tax=Campylobacter sp. CCUG 57310 TaxID=2517362 RepID=UPI001563724A|nr:glucosaminidase domain-containing protein [Campylobacter sp. CCUG 57310]
MRILWSKIWLVLLVVTSLNAGFSDEYYTLKGKAKKEAFIAEIGPIIVNVNSVIASKREFCVAFVVQAWRQGLRELDEDSYIQLAKIASEHNIKHIFNVNEYLVRIREIPVSLAIAQAAIESGWGESRFTKEANNIFGHYTWGEVGLVPLDRARGKRHKIRIFSSLQESVQMYALNLNSNVAYENFRLSRAEFARSGRLFSGLSAAETMQNYSELGEEYVKMLKTLINQLDLTKYDY